MAKKKKSIDDEINHILLEMEGMSVGSQDYVTASNNLQNLCKARSCENERAINPNTLILAGTNILGILIIISYEKWNVISSKALGFILRGHI